MSDIQPRFKHSCDKCTFLGCFNEFDLYHHPGDMFDREVVIAKGSDNELTDSHSMGMPIPTPDEEKEYYHPALLVAHSLARYAGLTQEKTDDTTGKEDKDIGEEAEDELDTWETRGRRIKLSAIHQEAVAIVTYLLQYLDGSDTLEDLIASIDSQVDRIQVRARAKLGARLRSYIDDWVEGWIED